MLLRLIAAVTGIFTLISHASVTLPGDGPYSRWQEDRIQYIFDPHSREMIPHISAYMQFIRKQYDMSFGWRLDENVDLILTSPRQQIPNAYATVMPNLKSVWFPSGPELLERMAQSSWVLALATHETAHLYQLNAKGPLNAKVKRVLGNSLGTFPFVWPIVIHPNIFTPGFLVEGNAVLNESRANLGGRLHSGEIRALVLAQIQEGQIDPNRLINLEWRFPYRQMAYTQGGYFQAHLAAKYGIEKTNQFFVAQGDRYLWPLILNNTFREHFGASYPLEIREYTRSLAGMAQNQKTTTGKLLTQSEYISPLNHDEHSIFYLSTNGLEPAQLHRLQKSDHSVTVNAVDLPFAKVFFDGDRPRVATSLRHDLRHIEYSLYSEGEIFDPRYRGQIVTDQRSGKTVSVDAKNSWLDSQILLDGEPFDMGHSLPVLDQEGSVYYFRQNGVERILYKNRTPIFKYEGFYGKLTEVSADGTIYFIANTSYGSSLYQYRGQELSRVFASDRVVDARSIDGFRFLVTEVYADGHRTYISEAQRSPESPALYSYGFTNYNLIPEQAVAEEQVKTDEREYNSLRELRYSGTNFAGFWDRHDGLGIYLDTYFTDPLEYQYYSLGAAGTTLGRQRVFAKWALTKYLPQFEVRYVFERERWQQTNGADRFSYNQEIFAGFRLPLLRWRHWDAQWLMLPNYKFNGARNVGSEQTYGVYNEFDFQFAQAPDPYLSFYPWREFGFKFQNRLESQPGAFAKKHNTSLVQMKYLSGFPKQIYATLWSGVGWAESYDLEVAKDSLSMSHDLRIPRLVSKDKFSVRSAASARLELTQVLNMSVYSTRIPFAVERLAPVAVAQGIFLDDQGTGRGDYPPNTFEWGVGIDFQVLLLHSIQGKIRLLHAYDTRHPQVKDSESSLKLEAAF